MRKHIQESKILKRINRKKRIRANISGCAEKPRVSVFRSNRYFSVQAIDDTTNTTVAALNSKALNLKPNREDAAKLAEAFAAKLKDIKVESIVFDRNGYIYHGVVKSFADALRNSGIKF